MTKKSAKYCRKERIWAGSIKWAVEHASYERNLREIFRQTATERSMRVTASLAYRAEMTQQYRKGAKRMGKRAAHWGAISRGKSLKAPIHD
jgi:hypothetical protein